MASTITKVTKKDTKVTKRFGHASDSARVATACAVDSPASFSFTLEHFFVIFVLSFVPFVVVSV